MEILKSYLDTIFKDFPDTEEVCKAKEELFQMMEDKYLELINDGLSQDDAVYKVIAEFGNIDELKKEIFNDKFTENENLHSNKNVTETHISDEEVYEYFENIRQSSKKISLGTFLCILSPSLLIFLSMLASGNNSYISEEFAVAFGLGFLFTMVAIAVMIFILNTGRTEKHKKYQEWENTPLHLNPNLKSKLNESFEVDSQRNIKYVALGVVLCILAVAQVCIISLFSANGNNFGISISLVTFFLFTGVATVLFIRSQMLENAYRIILNKNEYKVNISGNKATQEIPKGIGGVFWPLVVIAYLAWSFISFDWHITWIIWPIASLVFASLSSLYNMKKK